MTDILERLHHHARVGDGWTRPVAAEAADEIERLREALRIADAACRSYWGWEYGRPGDVDNDDVPDSSLLVKWRRNYEARTKAKEIRP